MTTQEFNRIKVGLEDMAFEDIKRASKGGSKMGAFILASCFIEYMAGFKKGGSTTRTDYINFVKTYLKSYNAKNLYTDLRCKLVHNYSEGGSFLFVDGKQNLHLKKEQATGKIFINLENFIEELKGALDTLLDDIKKNKNQSASNALQRLQSIGLLNVGTTIFIKNK